MPTDLGTSRLARVRLVVDRDHYDTLIALVRNAKNSVWISTANLKEMLVEAPIGTRARARGRFASIAEDLRDLVRRGVDVRMLHASPPSGPMTRSLSRATEVRARMKMCPRVHLKMIAVDGASLYLGSANFTGAGLGAKGDGRRNFEMGIMTDDDVMLDQAQARFDAIWRGKECAFCKLYDRCPKPIAPRERKGAKVKRA